MVSSGSDDVAVFFILKRKLNLSRLFNRVKHGGHFPGRANESGQLTPAAPGEINSWPK
jgi:hypothetical protein